VHARLLASADDTSRLSAASPSARTIRKPPKSGPPPPAQGLRAHHALPPRQLRTPSACPGPHLLLWRFGRLCVFFARVGRYQRELDVVEVPPLRLAAVAPNDCGSASGVSPPGNNPQTFKSRRLPSPSWHLLTGTACLSLLSGCPNGVWRTPTGTILVGRCGCRSLRDEGADCRSEVRPNQTGLARTLQSTRS
jgi:hypothetical protein